MKAIISDKARKILNDPQGSKQLMELVVGNVKVGEVELSNGDKYTVTIVNGATVIKGQQ